MEQTVFTVGQVNQYLKAKLDGDRLLSAIAIRGEISQEDFWSGYEELKEKGLKEVIADGDAYYQAVTAGGGGA